MKLIEEVKDIAQKTELNISLELNDQEFIQEFKDEVNWINISKYQVLSESFIREFKDEVNWYYISKYQVLSESFIREFKDEVNWNRISQYQLLSESFIREFKDKVQWDEISIYQVLSEPFIREFKDKVDWYWISQCQLLSEPFIREFKDKVDWAIISAYQVLSNSFIKEFNLTAPSHSWRKASDEDKKEAIDKSGLYEVKKGWVYGYKSVDKHLRSVHRSTFHYEVGKTYESSCDFNCDVENSFGLSMWSKEGAEDFHSGGRTLRVRARLSEVGALVHDAHKLRCVKLEILEEI